ncbi:MAG: hypothetical protein Q7U04_11785, partial [Bacteriovorax sp.]|nr:hypothetical protein [Bacteriovorax sp.]
MFKKLLLFILCSAFSSIGFSQIISFGKFTIGESRVHADLNDFLIHTHQPEVMAVWVPDSVQWIRNENNLLVPRALLKIMIKKDLNLIHISYHDTVVFPVKRKKIVVTEIYVDLFNPDIVSIYAGKTLLDKIVIEASSAINARSKQLIDYSCAPYNLKIEGIDSEYLSIGCKMSRLGRFGNERPRLEITLSSTNLRMLNDAKPPYTIYLEDNSPIDLDILGGDQKIKHFHLEASIPNRLNRLKTALGFGPYIYQSEFLANGISLNQKNNLAPSLMIYGKLDINETSSFKAFDALLYSKSRFNNSGLYFSYDLADAFDGRILLSALLGFQGLHYQYASENPTEFRLIYPQGFEVVYKHAFIENYHATYGMFLSTNSAEVYTNAWLRYGKSSFLEINYINWGHEFSKIKMWGLS